MIPLADVRSVNTSLSLQDRGCQERILLRKRSLAVHVQLKDTVLITGIDLIQCILRQILRGFHAVPGIPLRHADHVQALLNVQLPLLSVLKPVIVIKPVGDIAVLLGFQNQGVSLDGMYRAGIDLKKIPLPDGNLPDQFPPTDSLLIFSSERVEVP